MIQEGSQEGKIKALVGDDLLDVEINKRSRKFRINETIVPKQQDFFGRFAVVVLTPEHRRIVEGGKQERRMFLDHFLCMTDPSYMGTLKDHNKVCKHLRALIKDAQHLSDFKTHAAVWDDQHQDLSQTIRTKRKQALSQLSPYIFEAAQEITRRQNPLDFSYATFDAQSDRLSSYFYAKRLTHGAQRDDIEMTWMGRSIKTYASQGEKAATLLAMKLGEQKAMAKNLGAPPVLMLDDIGTTLDQARRKHLLNHLHTSAHQTLISTCDPLIYQELMMQEGSAKDVNPYPSKGIDMSSLIHAKTDANQVSTGTCESKPVQV